MKNVDFLIGADLGKERDPAAIVVVSRTALVQPKEPEYPFSYEVRFVEQVPLRTPYPRLVDYIEKLAMQDEIYGRCMIAADHTGVGQVVLDMLRDKPALENITWAVYYTSGKNEKQELMNFNVPKRQLVHNLLIVMQKGLFGISDGAAGSSILQRELLRFIMKRTAAAHDKFEAEGNNDHDDTVNAAACAVYLGQNVPQEESLYGIGRTFAPSGITTGNALHGMTAAHNAAFGYQPSAGTSGGGRQGFERPQR